jgi:tetratricopeptide (TPR) repeat protein
MSHSKPTSPIQAPSTAENDDFESAKEALRATSLARHPRLREAALLLEKRRFEDSTTLLRDFLKDHPRDVRAVHLMAQIAMRQNRTDDARALLEQCIELAPDFVASRYSYANMLMKLNRPEAAFAQADELTKCDPPNPLFRARKATILEKIGNYEAAAKLWRGLIDDYPFRPESWERYGNALRVLGRLEDAVVAYRKLVELDPHSGIPWWHLADMKTFRFAAGDIDQMERELASTELTASARIFFHFSLGKAYADLKLYEKSFSHYAKGNAIQRIGLTHDSSALTARVANCKKALKPDFFRDRFGCGCDSRAPIFLVGMLRAGSTLVEQILASHSQVEGTRELSDLTTISRQLEDAASRERHTYLQVLANLDAAALRNLGESYLERVRAHRKLDRPFFTDKMGENYFHIGLIQLILPNAKIIDVRRHPLACCFSNFAQIFPDGQNNAYRLSDIGHNYGSYVELMAHFDRVLPGRVHRIFYENLVTEPGAEIRRLLGYLGLPFEEDCLRFYKTERAVTTVSAEQVRKPIYRDAIDQWRDYEPWLGPLKAALGPVLDLYPDVPAFG